MDVPGGGEEPRRLLEGGVGGERHPGRGEVVRDIDGGGAWALGQHGGLLRFGNWRLCRKLSASLRDGNANGPLYSSLFGRFEDRPAHRSAAPTQNTSPSELSVSSHSSGNCGNAASSASRPRPISHNSPPRGVRCRPASFKMRRLTSSPSAPPSRASFGP